MNRAFKRAYYLFARIHCHVIIRSMLDLLQRSWSSVSSLLSAADVRSIWCLSWSFSSDQMMLHVPRNVSSITLYMHYFLCDYARTCVYMYTCAMCTRQNGEAWWVAHCWFWSRRGRYAHVATRAHWRMQVQYRRLAYRDAERSINLSDNRKASSAVPRDPNERILKKWSRRQPKCRTCSVFMQLALSFKNKYETDERICLLSSRKSEPEEAFRARVPHQLSFSFR